VCRLTELREGGHMNMFPTVRQPSEMYPMARIVLAKPILGMSWLILELLCYQLLDINGIYFNTVEYSMRCGFVWQLKAKKKYLLEKAEHRWRSPTMLFRVLNSVVVWSIHLHEPTQGQTWILLPDRCQAPDLKKPKRCNMRAHKNQHRLSRGMIYWSPDNIDLPLPKKAWKF